MSLGACLSLALAVLGVESWSGEPRNWKSCGPPVLMKDIAPGATGSEPRELVHGNGVLFFTADDGAHGRELWKSSGTGGAGTFLVADVRPGPLGSEPHALTVVGDRVFFIADDGVDGQQLWVSDGTARGTRQLTRLHPDLLGIYPSLIDYRGALYFSANDGEHGFELWRSDGTPEGTVLVDDVYPGSNGSYPRALAIGGDGALYFGATFEDFVSIYRSEGTPGAVPLGGQSIGHYLLPTRVGDLLYFRLDPDGPVGVLWRTDGTLAGTVELTGFDHEMAGSSPPEELTGFKGKLYFRAGADRSPTGVELWRSDGTREGTHLVKDLRPGAGGSWPDWLEVLDDRLFFTADDGVHGRELWRSDGTASGTRLFKDLLPGPLSALPEELRAIQGTLFFSAELPGQGREPWVSDGTPGGTVPLADLAPGAASSNPRSFLRSGWDVFFVADDGAHGPELWALPFRPGDACD
ncbi:hypothetical protein DAT35_16885 [Vitiosangium sp. GDMCC 1.1324]|nr:hypothetical protein DAT35_16885 [Vitiosangium sp. GDMCC 1.1324]